jgi:hypothetical protein
MEPDEIRAEIERRKKLARDLKLRETLWSLYYWNFRGYGELLGKDPELVYPEIKETLNISDKEHIQFSLKQTMYQFVYKEGPAEERESWGSRRGLDDEETITPATLALEVNGQRVFDFNIRKSVRYTRDAPLFNESMGEITSFIQGPWASDLTELLPKITSHKNDVRDRRQAPKVQQQLKEDMKRFGMQGRACRAATERLYSSNIKEVRLYDLLAPPSRSVPLQSTQRNQ